MILLSRILVTLALFMCPLNLEPAHGADQPNAVIQLTNVAAVALKDYSRTPQIQLSGYYVPNDGGEGTLVLMSCTPDGGSCFSDSAGNTYKRTNLNGQLAQYGVTTGSPYDWLTHGVSSSDVTPILQAAKTALRAVGLSTINTLGISVHMMTSWSTPAGFTFTCNVTPGQPTTGWYDTMKGAVYKAHGVVWDSGGKATGRNNCIILPDLIPTMPSGSASAQAQRSLSDAILTAGDTGLNCDAEGCLDENLWILGFDTDYDARNAADSVVNNIVADGNVCFRISSTGSATRWGGTQCRPLLNQGLDNSEEHFDITNISSGSGGVCHLTVTPSSDSQAGILADLPYAIYMYIARLPNGPSACANQYGGLWKINNINTATGTFDLIASSIAGVTPRCHWAAGTHIIYCSSSTNLSTGLSVTTVAAQGIPNPSISQNVWPLPPQTGGYITDTGGSANTYVSVGTDAQQPCTLGDGTNIPLIAAHDNTGASTLNVTLSSDPGCTGGTTGAIAIEREDFTALQAHDIVASTQQLLRYDLTHTAWILIQPKVYLDQATTIAQSAPFQVPFAGATCTGHTSGAGGCGASSQALFLFTTRVDAGSSSAGIAAGGTGSATAYLVGGPVDSSHTNSDKVAGFQIDQPQAFDHTYEFHIQNSNETGFTNAGTDSHGNDDDPNPVIWLFDGGINNAHVVGRKASKGGRTILINTTYPNNPDRGAITIVGMSAAATTGALPVVDVEQGTVEIFGLDTNSSGVNFISNFASNVRMDTTQPNVTNIFEGSAAQSVTCTLGSNFAGGAMCPNGAKIPVTIVTGATTIDGSAQIYQCNASGGAVPFTVNAGSSLPNFSFSITKVDSTSNLCTVTMQSGETIGGASATALAVLNDALKAQNVNGSTSWMFTQ